MQLSAIQSKYPVLMLYYMLSKNSSRPIAINFRWNSFACLFHITFSLSSLFIYLFFPVSLIKFISLFFCSASGIAMKEENKDEQCKK